MWAQIINATLGSWLMAAPDVLHYSSLARANHHIVGPMAATFAIIALWEVTRPVRWVNLPLGIWLLLSPWILGYTGTGAFNSAIVGILMASLALVRGTVRQRFAKGWASLWKLGVRGE